MYLAAVVFFEGNNLQLPDLCDTVIEIHIKAEDILRTFGCREIQPR